MVHKSNLDHNTNITYSHIASRKHHTLSVLQKSGSTWQKIDIFNNKTVFCRTPARETVSSGGQGIEAQALKWTQLGNQILVITLSSSMTWARFSNLSFLISKRRCLPNSNKEHISHQSAWHIENALKVIVTIITNKSKHSTRKQVCLLWGPIKGN